MQTKITGDTFASEAADYGLAPRDTILTGSLHAKTPMAVTGAKTITTGDLQRLITATPDIVLVDVLDGRAHPSVPNAAWADSLGLGTGFEDSTQASFESTLTRLTGSNKARPVVFFCRSSHCWLSYNATLRAVKAGYKTAYWYRGGIDAWVAAGLPTEHSTVR